MLPPAGEEETMRLTLVQPPNGLYDCYDLAPPLGLLTVAAAVEQDGVDVTLIDINLLGMRDHSWSRGDFYTRALSAIAATEPDVVGFTSMVVESHVCLELARRLKAADPGVIIVLGGPHFSAIAAEVLRLYPWIDYVITGEGEWAAQALLRFLRGRAASSDLLNVAYRDGGGVRLDRRLKPLPSMAELPGPAYHLVDLPLYFQTNPMRLLDYEHGRGCIFKCSFCYSPVHWGQGEQVKEVDRIVEEVAHLYGLGARHLFFVQDNFPNSKPVARAICQELTRARTGMTWNCYATLPHLTPDLLDDLAAAGCQAVFVGVDAITADAQRSFGKPFFRGWEKLAERLRACLERGIVPTCAFMIDIPEGDSRATDEALTTALFVRTLGCGIRLNTLTLYNETASDLALRGRPRLYTELKPRLLLDTPEMLHDNPYAREHPELFPFHHTFLPLPVYSQFVTGMHLAYTLFTSFPRTLLQYVLADGGSLWGLLASLADRLSDLVTIPAVLRRPMERELFLKEFPRLPLSTETRSALELETAELRLGRNDPAETVSLRVDDRLQSYRAQRYNVIRLPHPPGRFDEVARLPEIQGEGRPYLMVRQDKQIRYFEVDEAVVPLLDQIRAAERSGETVEVPPGVLAEMLTAGVLHNPPQA
jgi:radical SAM superfamily enzyme YgiQ (UPF0313 family)